MTHSDAALVPGSRVEGLGWLIGLHFVLLAWLVFAAGTSLYCCDAWYYLETSERLLQDGLYYADDYAGYRSYLVPLVIGVLRRLLVFAAVEKPIHIQFPLVVCYVAVVFACALHITRREGLKRYFTAGFPIAFNPIVLGVVIFPMQEAVAALSCIPMLMLLLSSRAPLSHGRLALALLFVVTAYLIRSSWIWLVLPVGIFLAVLWHRQRRQGMRLQGRLWPLPAATLVCMALLLPQMLIAKKQFDSWNPYPSSTVATRQIAAGIAMFRYTTVIGGPHQGGFPTYTPFKDEPDKTLGFYTTHPAEGAALVLGHVWAGLNYDTFGVYVSWASLGPVTAALLFSATVSALGLFGLVAWPGKGDDTELRAFLTTGLLGSCAYTALAATETRFGLWGFLCVSMAVAHLLAEKEGRRWTLRASPYVLVYVLTAAQINASFYLDALG